MKAHVFFTIFFNEIFLLKFFIFTILYFHSVVFHDLRYNKFICAFLYVTENTNLHYDTIFETKGGVKSMDSCDSCGRSCSKWHDISDQEAVPPTEHALSS